MRENSLPLWNSILRYHFLVSLDEDIEQLYIIAMGQPAKIRNALKPDYIEWLSLVRGINKTREEYERVANEEPFCLELHIRMIKIESMQLHCDINKWERVHELACEQFGHDNVDVWINYMKFYLHFNNKDDYDSKVLEIFSRAEKKLPETHKFELNKKHRSLLNT